MSEVQQRPPPALRGRGSYRGGRARTTGTRPNRNSNGDTNVSYSIEDQSEIGQLKKQYSAQLVTLGEMFSDWSTENLLTTLQENGGDLQATATKISEGPYFTFKPFSCLLPLLCDPTMSLCVVSKLKFICTCP